MNPYTDQPTGSVVDQVRRYAEAVVEAAAIGPDPAAAGEGADTEGLVDPSRAGDRRGSRVALVACLAALVVAAAGTVIVLRGTGSTAPAVDPVTTTVLGGDAQLSVAVTVTVTGADGSVRPRVTARTEITNVSAAPVTVVADAGWFTRLVSDAPTARSPEAQRQLDPVYAIYAAASFIDVTTDITDPDPPDRPRSVVLESGRSIVTDSYLEVGTEVPTGEVRVEVVPERVEVRDDGEVRVPARDAVVSVPVTIPSPGGQLTRPDAAAIALADPRVQEWFDAAAEHGAAGGFTGGANRTDAGWRVRYGPLTGPTDGDAEMRAGGGPGFIVDVADDGTVSVDWLVLPGD